MMKLLQLSRLAGRWTAGCRATALEGGRCSTASVLLPAGWPLRYIVRNYAPAWVFFVGIIGGASERSFANFNAKFSRELSCRALPRRRCRSRYCLGAEGEESRGPRGLAGAPPLPGRGREWGEARYS